MTGYVIITVAPNGSYKTKRDHPNLPMTCPEIVETVAECVLAGAAQVHLHVRDQKGQHSLDPSTYRETIASIECAIQDLAIVQITSESAGKYTPDLQVAAIRNVRPEAVSVALREIAPTSDSADTKRVQQLDAEMKKLGTHIQYIAYAPSDVLRFNQFLDCGAIHNDNNSLLFVIGSRQDPATANPRTLDRFLRHTRPRTIWSVCAFGPAEYECALAAIEMGGHVRVGFENNLQLRDGAMAPSNGALVQQVAEAARAAGRAPATAEQARAIINSQRTLSLEPA